MENEDKKFKLIPFPDSNSTPPVEYLDRVRASTSLDNATLLSSSLSDKSLIQKVINELDANSTLSRYTAPINSRQQSIDGKASESTFIAGSIIGRRASFDDQGISTTKEASRTSHINYRDQDSSDDEQQRISKRNKRTSIRNNRNPDGPSYIPHYSVGYNRTGVSSSSSSSTSQPSGSTTNITTTSFSSPSTTEFYPSRLWSSAELKVLQNYMNACTARNRKKNWVAFLKQHDWIKKTPRQLSVKASYVSSLRSIETKAVRSQGARESSITVITIEDTDDEMDEDLPGEEEEEDEHDERNSNFNTTELELEELQIDRKVAITDQVVPSESSTSRNIPVFYTTAELALLQNYIDKCALEGIARDWIEFKDNNPTFERSRKQLAGKANVMTVSPSVIKERFRKTEALRIQVLNRRAEELRVKSKYLVESNAVAGPSNSAGVPITSTSIKGLRPSSVPRKAPTTKSPYIQEIPRFVPLSAKKLATATTTPPALSNSPSNTLLAAAPKIRGDEEENSTGKPWPISELQHLKRLVATVDGLGFGRDWGTIALELNSGRKVKEVKAKWKSFEEKKKGDESKKELAQASKKEVTNTTTISWSTKEIASLLAEIALQSLTSVTIDWNTVAATVGGDKDSDKCRSKWFEIKKEENEKRGSKRSNSSTTTRSPIMKQAIPPIGVSTSSSLRYTPYHFSSLVPSSVTNTSNSNQPRITAVPLDHVYNTPRSFLHLEAAYRPIQFSPYSTPSSTFASTLRTNPALYPSTVPLTSSTTLPSTIIATVAPLEVDHCIRSANSTPSVLKASLQGSSVYNPLKNSIPSPPTSKASQTPHQQAVDYKSYRHITMPSVPQLPSSSSSLPVNPSGNLFPPTSRHGTFPSTSSSSPNILSSNPVSLSLISTRSSQPPFFLKRDSSNSSTNVTNPITTNAALTNLILTNSSTISSLSSLIPPKGSESSSFSQHSFVLNSDSNSSITTNSFSNPVSSDIVLTLPPTNLFKISNLSSSILSSPPVAKVSRLPPALPNSAVTLAPTISSTKAAVTGISSEPFLATSTDKKIISFQEAQDAMARLLTTNWDD